MFDKRNKGRNAFFYACEMNFKYMLQMLIQNFRVESSVRVTDKWSLELSGKTGF